MSQTTLSIRMDEATKKQFDTFCNDVGMNASVAVNIFVKTVLREKKIPFAISSEVNNDPFYSQSNQNRLIKAAQRMNETGGKIHELIEVNDD